MDGYKTGLASLFTAAARIQRRYVYHKDWQKDGWNVFEDVEGKENFIKFFKELDDAQGFCDINNGLVEADHVSAD